MDYQEKTVLLKNGKPCLLRAVEESDAETLLEYLHAISAETPYMAREPEEVRTSVEGEAERIRNNLENPRALHLMAEVDGVFAGSCSFSPNSDRMRCRHRCHVGISVYRAFWGMGVGTALMEELLTAARSVGFEQAELDVVSANARAVGLYQKLGFVSIGTMPRAMKYKDGSYVDFLLMVKQL